MSRALIKGEAPRCDGSAAGGPRAPGRRGKRWQHRGAHFGHNEHLSLTDSVTTRP